MRGIPYAAGLGCAVQGVFAAASHGGRSVVLAAAVAGSLGATARGQQAASAVTLNPQLQRVLADAKISPSALPGPLSVRSVPTPADLALYVRDVEAARRLGKAFFWDQQVGGDGATACATCHWNAGADVRVRNTLAPHGPGLKDAMGFRGANALLRTDDFPFRKLANAFDANSKALRDTAEIAGSSGVVRASFAGLVPKKATDASTPLPDPVFQAGGSNVRQVTARNAPSVINAAFNDRQFWDGRASRYFNGVNPFGPADSSARVWRSDGKTARQASVLIDNASLASQAAGPPNNSVEMSWDGRSFPLLGRKMLALRPLGSQRVDPTDSLLGAVAASNGIGLAPSVSYASLIRQAFQPEWWQAPKSVDGEFTQMEANFSLFWGLSLQLYQATLVSDDAPYDRFVQGNAAALTSNQVLGLRLFLSEGKCINCHKGPEFAGGTVSSVRPTGSQEKLIERMRMGNRIDAFYDSGFYNIGVRPSREDLGVGADGPFGPFSYTAQRSNSPAVGTAAVAAATTRTAIRGAFKTPTLRNVSLTGPYFHNGGQSTLAQVIEFYARGGDFSAANAADLAPDIQVLPIFARDPKNVAALEDFLRALTDPRVEYQRAPFDHPQLLLAHDGRPGDLKKIPGALVELPPTGAAGGASLREFSAVLVDGQPVAATAGRK